MSQRSIIAGCLTLAVSGLIVLGMVARHPGIMPVRVSPVAFLVLLAVELTLLLLTTSREPRVASAARIAIFLVPLLMNLGVRAYLALGTPDLLEWDETYYMSLAVTAAGGRGLYPYIFGYEPMAIMGGIGYAAYAYALAVLVAGPTILGLRLVSLAAALAGLACVWLLVRLLYGSGTAWMATAIASSLRLFVMSNTVRMDSMAFAYVAGALLVFTLALKRWEDRRRHLLAGLVFGLGLQVHIDTAVTALACGAIYVAIWVHEMWRTKQRQWQPQMLWYIVGWSVGVALFLCGNVLPDPTAFYKTTVLTRVDATSWYSTGTSSLVGSFLNPHILLAKELARYRVLFRALPGAEILLAATAFIALVVRRGLVDRLILIGIAGVLIAASVVLNNASPLYYIHITPLLMLPMAPLLTHGLTRVSKVSTRDLTTSSLLAFIVCISALCALNNVKSVWGRRHDAKADAADAAFAARVRSAADRRCRIAGDGGMYVRRFADYPFFISSRPTEVKYAMLYYGATDEAAYWDIKKPDVVFSRGELSEGMSRYVARRGLSQLEPNIWAMPGGCTPTDDFRTRALIVINRAEPILDERPHPGDRIAER